MRAFKFIGTNNPFVVLGFRLLGILVLLSISRLSLYFFNPELFGNLSFEKITMIYLNGLRFDISILFILTSLLILANTIPLVFRWRLLYQRVVDGLTVILVSFAIFSNLADVIYYRFTMKRMSFDIFNYLTSDTGLTTMAPRFLIDYWYVVVLAALAIFGLIYVFNKTRIENKIEKPGWRFYFLNSIFFLLSAFIIIIGIRGGIGKKRLRPLCIADAGLYASPELTPLVLNTPFTIIKSIGQTRLYLKNDFSEPELKKIFNPIHSYQPLNHVPENIENVIVIILESFSTEHIGYFNEGKGCTPFLDSLFNHSLVFSAMANGKRSVEGIPAILSSIPTLTNQSFLMGPYAANQIEGLARTLSEHDYKTAFFHGGKNGTMNLDAYALASGFESYYGMSEYPNKDDFDGFWGIWDDVYLKYSAGKINDMEVPFLATVFTLSSHSPYRIPEDFNTLLPQGMSKIQKSITYTDWALSHFFDEVKSMDWYANTLFVITADHTSEGISKEYNNCFGQFKIPLAFFCPSDESLKSKACSYPVQQTDIFPSVLNYLGITDPILCFGNSIFDPNYFPFAINYSNFKTQILNDSMLLQVQGDKVDAVYAYQKDFMLQQNIKDVADYSKLLKFHSAFIQQYNNRMIQNRLRANSAY